MKKTHTHEIDR